MRQLSLIFKSICMFGAVLVLSCVGGSKSPTGPELPDTFTLTGKILENDTGISEVSVRITGNGIDKTVTTNTSGIYSFSDLPDGTYTVTPFMDGYTFKPSSIKVAVSGANAIADTIAATKIDIETHEIHGIPFVLIPGGTFTMGDVEGVGFPNEIPVHKVALDGFEMSTTEITNARYTEYLNEAYKSNEITATNTSVKGTSGDYKELEYVDLSDSYDTNNICWIRFVNDTFSVESGKENRPIVYVTWHGAKAFALHYGFDLPTEAEWEYAARGGKQYKYGTDDGTLSGSKANYGRIVGYPVDVGSYPANPFGLYDLCGNVWEWCNDWYGYYSSDDVNNPSGAHSGTHRVPRGGGWFVFESLCRSAVRSGDNPGLAAYNLGFRVVKR